MTAPAPQSQPEAAPLRQADVTELHRQGAAMFLCWPTNAVDLAKNDSDLPELVEKLAQFIANWEAKGAKASSVKSLGDPVAWRHRHSRGHGLWAYGDEKPGGPSIHLFEVEALALASNLRPTLAEYALDLRRNPSGGDDYPYEIMRAVADRIDQILAEDAT